VILKRQHKNNDAAFVRKSGKIKELNKNAIIVDFIQQIWHL
jgi:hypothetical protein